MSVVRPCALPEDALLRKYQSEVGFTDCYCTDVTVAVSQQAYVEAFYTTALFKLERFVLAWLAGRPSSDAQARELAQCEIDRFAAWQVEGRTASQLLLADFTGRTRSWLMVLPWAGEGNAVQTRLLFGSAMLARGGIGADSGRMGIAFHLLLGFHRLYSRLLLRSARSRVLRLGRRDAGSPGGEAG